MKAVLFGETVSHIIDTLGFVDQLENMGMDKFECISVIISEEKDVPRVVKHRHLTKTECI